MFASVKYVLQENTRNFYRTISVVKYELLADMRSSKLGLFWNFANPAIQVFTYWFLFGYIFNRGGIDGIPYLPWMLGGMTVWFFMGPCITEGCAAISSKMDIITRMKFPISILPMTVVLKRLFHHLCHLCITVIVLAIFGYYPSVHWFGLLYYCLCGVLFSFSLAMVLSVLNMLARDTRKLVSSCMKLIMYMSPILWNVKGMPEWIQTVASCNPIYYVVQGYRDCFFYHQGFAAYSHSAAWYWGITAGLFVLGSYLMYKYKGKFMDML